MTGIERIAAAFAGSGKRAALMPYMMAGFPDLETSRAIGEAYADGGADLIELGAPFSDPLADGPVIHEAGTVALRGGTTFADVLALGAQLAERVPIVLMAYANLVYARGFDAFVALLVEHSISGLIVPDLPIEEAPSLRELCDARGVALVPIVGPTTPDERLERIGAHARGFLYTVSVTGTTGERDDLDMRLVWMLRRVAGRASVPVAIGFGIGTPDQAASAANAGAGGVIVGSRLVRAAGESEDPPAAVRELVAGFADALAEPAPSAGALR
jgi:tryptophan synthase alpha chain